MLLLFSFPFTFSGRLLIICLLLLLFKVWLFICCNYWDDERYNRIHSFHHYLFRRSGCFRRAHLSLVVAGCWRRRLIWTDFQVVHFLVVCFSCLSLFVCAVLMMFSFTFSDAEDWFCECPPLYTGRLCQLSACERSPCSHGATCIPKSPLEAVCLCPYGRQGLLCDQGKWHAEQCGADETIY